MSTLAKLTGWVPVITTRRALAARLENAETVGSLDAFRYAQERDNAWWRGYAQALRDGTPAALANASREQVVELRRRIEAGPPAPARPALRVIRGGAA